MLFLILVALIAFLVVLWFSRRQTYEEETYYPTTGDAGVTRRRDTDVV